MKHGTAALTAAVIALAVTPAALAQDAGGTDVTWFSQFFITRSAVGLLIIWTLVAMSMGSLGFIVHLAVRYRKSSLIPDAVRNEIRELIADGRWRAVIDYTGADPSYLSRVTGAALREANSGYVAMERAIEEAGDAETARILRPLEYLNVIGNIAPMLGLFGTVYGMIEAFQVLVAEGGSPDPAKLAAGISTALVTTFWGLIVAMPALAGYALIRNRVDALTSEGILMAEELIRPFKPSAAKKPESPQRPRATPNPEG